MEVVVVFTDGRGRDREVRAELPGPERLAPVFGTSWTPGAPVQ